jgi:hypothetical protein
VVGRRAQVLPKLDPVPGQTAWVDEDGNLMMVASAPWVAGMSAKTISLYRFDTTGQGRATALVSWPIASGPQDGFEKRPYVEAGALLRATRDGGAYVAVSVRESQDGVKRSRASLYRLNADGYVVVEHPLHAPTQAATPGPDAVSLRAMDVSSDGLLRIALHHRVPLSLDGAVITPSQLATVGAESAGTITLVTMQLDGAAIQSVFTSAPAPCVRLRPGSISQMVHRADDTFVLGGGSRMPGCWDGRPTDGAVSRLQP